MSRPLSSGSPDDAMPRPLARSRLSARFEAKPPPRSCARGIGSGSSARWNLVWPEPAPTRGPSAGGRSPAAMRAAPASAATKGGETWRVSAPARSAVRATSAAARAGLVSGPAGAGPGPARTVPRQGSRMVGVESAASRRAAALSVPVSEQVRAARRGGSCAWASAELARRTHRRYAGPRRCVDRQRRSLFDGARGGSGAEAGQLGPRGSEVSCTLSAGADLVLGPLWMSGARVVAFARECDHVGILLGQRARCRCSPGGRA